MGQRVAVIVGLDVALAWGLKGSKATIGQMPLILLVKKAASALSRASKLTWRSIKTMPHCWAMVLTIWAIVPLIPHWSSCGVISWPSICINILLITPEYIRESGRLTGRQFARRSDRHSYGKRGISPSNWHPWGIVIWHRHLTSLFSPQQIYEVLHRLLQVEFVTLLASIHICCHHSHGICRCFPLCRSI